MGATKPSACLSGDLVITNGATVTGTGVTIVLTTNQRSSANSGIDVGNVYIDSSSALNITAPTTAPSNCASCTGIAVWQDPCLTTGTNACTAATPSPTFPIMTPPTGVGAPGADDENLIGTGASTNITGVVYFPAQAVIYSGADTPNTTSCTQIVAWGIWFVNNTQFTYGSNCPATAGVGAIAGVPVLVE